VVSDKARGAFERALALDAAAVKPRFYLARAAEQDGKRDLALERYTALAAASPPDAPWMPVLRDSIQRLGGSAPAPAQVPAPALSEEQRTAIRGMIASLDQRLSETGGTPDEWARLVRSYGVMGERDKAEDALRRARAALADKAAPVDAAARDLGLTAAPASP
jgi:cytochrome c-type biogenesis protein CcmH